uniref:Uncharacterized protein n=1 Tax=Arundo donax TaxID=35708 RepID=A0A0A9ETV2_ARUDO
MQTYTSRIINKLFSFLYVLGRACLSEIQLWRIPSHFAQGADKE